jgi:electron transfer flavoprotein beta subunit
MKAVVCVKVTPKVDQIRFDEVKKTVAREGVENELNESDKNALEVALRLKDQLGGTVVALSMGPPSFEPFLKLAVSMGADDAVLLSDRAFAGADTYATSLVLARGISKLAPFDLVLCGEASSDGSTEQVPPSVAEWLALPRISYASEIKLDGDRVTARRSIRGGYEVVEAKAPVLASIELGCNTPRFPNFRRKRWAETEFKMTTMNINDLGLAPNEVGLAGSLTEVTGLNKMRVPTRLNRTIEGSEEEVVRQLMQLLSV